MDDPDRIAGDYEGGADVGPARRFVWLGDLYAETTPMTVAYGTEGWKFYSELGDGPLADVFAYVLTGRTTLETETPSWDRDRLRRALAKEHNVSLWDVESKYDWERGATRENTTNAWLAGQQIEPEEYDSYDDGWWLTESETVEEDDATAEFFETGRFEAR